jgi:hypothetical protein
VSRPPELPHEPPASVTKTRYHRLMPTCRECQDEVDELVSVKLNGRRVKLCADCADRAREEGEIAQQSESVIQGMMGFKGRRGP